MRDFGLMEMEARDAPLPGNELFELALGAVTHLLVRGPFINDGDTIGPSPDKRAVVRREKDGTETILADSCEGQKLNAPNDLWLAPNGDVYFTLPKLRAAKAKKDGVPETVLNGTLCRISATRTRYRA